MRSTKISEGGIKMQKEVLGMEKGAKTGMWEIANHAQGELAQMTNLKPSGIIGISKEDAGWLIKVEMLEKKSIPENMDILGSYEIRLDEGGHVINFGRVRLRKRGDTEGE